MATLKDDVSMADLMKQAYSGQLASKVDSEIMTLLRDPVRMRYPTLKAPTFSEWEARSKALSGTAMGRITSDEITAPPVEAPKPRPRHPLKLNASYLHEALHRPESIVEFARRELREIEYDTIIGTGLSGALVLPLLARELGKHFAVVRKPDNTHSSYAIEGTIGDRWVFVDDLVSSGRTLRRVKREVIGVTRQHGHVATYIGAFCYYERGTSGDGFCVAGHYGNLEDIAYPENY